MLHPAPSPRTGFDVDSAQDPPARAGLASCIAKGKDGKPGREGQDGGGMDGKIRELSSVLPNAYIVGLTMCRGANPWDSKTS